MHKESGVQANQGILLNFYSPNEENAFESDMSATILTSIVNVFKVRQQLEAEARRTHAQPSGPPTSSRQAGVEESVAGSPATLILHSAAPTAPAARTHAPVPGNLRQAACRDKTGATEEAGHREEAD